MSIFELVPEGRFDAVKTEDQKVDDLLMNKIKNKQNRINKRMNKRK